jgi:hypothetical protein
MKNFSKLLIVLLLCQISFACKQEKNNPEVTPTPLKEKTPSIIEEIKSPAKINSSAPELIKTLDGKILMSWLEKDAEKQYSLYFSTLENNSWSTPKLISKSDNWFINWADIPSITKLSDGSLAAHWLAKSAENTYAYDINIVRSFDDGETWSKPIIPHTDGTKTEHGFVSLFPWGKDKLGAIWLDGRKIKINKNGDYDESDLSNEMTLRFTSIDKTGKLLDETALDERVCDCCPTSVALIQEGAIAVYRDRSKEEFRDISFVRYKEGKWSEPKAVSSDKWQIEGCPVNGPVVAAKGKQLAVAWFTSADKKAKVKLSFSNNEGETFNEPIIVSENEAVGRVDLTMLDDGSVLFIWLSGSKEIGNLNLLRIWPDGKKTKPIIVTKTAIERKSGIPKLVVNNEQAIVVWTDVNKAQVRTASLNLTSFQ